MNLIIAGSRGFNDYAELDRVLRELGVYDKRKSVTIISGGARGADTLGQQWASEHDIPVIIMPARWDLYGKSAGYRRNVEMAKQATHALVCWDGQSKGSQHMIDIAKDRGLKLYTFLYNSKFAR